MRTRYKEVFIFSAYLSNLSAADNAARHEMLLRTLSGWSIDYTEVLGVYKGQGEESVLVVPRNESQFKRLKMLALDSLNQESILYQDGEGMSWLEYQDGTVEKLGQLKPITEAQADKLDAYTVIRRQYWAAN